MLSVNVQKKFILYPSHKNLKRIIGPPLKPLAPRDYSSLSSMVNRGLQRAYPTQRAQPAQRACRTQRAYRAQHVQRALRTQRL